MRYKKMMAISLMFSINGYLAHAQSQLANITRPSPTVQAMQKFGDIPVSIYTGIPDITIPVYTVQFHDITVPVTLSYHASGIKVAEEASQEGLGWVLNAGGVVSRNIIGDDDFDGTSYLNTGIPDLDSGTEPQGRVQFGCILQLVNSGNPTLPTLYSDNLTNIIGGGYPSDLQPDQYYYNLLGKNGKFTIKHNGQVLLANQEKLDISFSAGGSSWEIKDEKGFIYDFTQFETYTSSAGTPSQHKSAWYLTQITSPLGNKVTFAYTALPANLLISRGSLWETNDVFQSPITSGSITYQPPTLGYQFGTAPGNTYYSIVLSSIDFTNGQVNFSYSANRPDLPGDVRLDSISVYDKTAYGSTSPTLVRTTALSYGYFLGDQTASITGVTETDTAIGPVNARLKLLSVQTTGYYQGNTVAENPYILNYTEGNPVNLPTKLSIARDHWGYYNGKVNNISLIPSATPIPSSDPAQSQVGVPGPERNTDTNYVKLFSLASITYPTKGSTELQMEANDYDVTLSQVNDHSLFSSLETLTPQKTSMIYDNLYHAMLWDSVLDLTAEYFDITAGSSTPMTIEVDVRMSSSGSSLYQLNNQGLIWFELVGSKGNIALTKDLGNLGICDQNQTTACLANNGGLYSYTYTNVFLPPDRYTMRAYVDSKFDTSVQQLLVNVNWQSMVATGQLQDGSAGSANYGFAGSLRVRRIIQHDSINPANDHIRHYIYHYQADKGAGLQEYSYGRRMARPEYFYFEWVIGQYTFGTESPASISYVSDHLMRSADSNIPLNGSAAGSPVGYDQVTVLDGDNGENGKSVYSYFNQPDYVYDYSYSDGVPHRPPVNSTIPFPLNGSLLTEVDYANVNGRFYKQKEVDNTYTPFPVQQDVLYGVEVRAPLTDGSTSASTSGCSGILLFYQALQSQWNYLQETDEKTYNQLTDTADYVENQMRFYYDNPAHFLRTRVAITDSKGLSLTTFTKYPLDYPAGLSSDAFSQGIANLNGAHVIDAPVEVYRQKAAPDGTNAFIYGGNIQSFSSTIPAPAIAYDLELSRPDYGFTPSAISASGSAIDPNYTARILFDQYDANGNVIQQHKVSDVKHSYIYDYNNTLPVAEVINAAAGDIAYTSFESTGNGNWSIPDTNRTRNAGITGSNAYPLHSSIQSPVLNASTTYIVSYWSDSGPYTVSGSIRTVTGGKRGAWTQYTDTVANSSSVTVTGNGNIDELRLYPKGAQMNTYTFSPLAGMTSHCDINGQITYYYYDGLMRLAFIKDQDGNIIKTFNYNYKQ